MNSDIQFLYSYQAGSKYIDGFFPIYNLNGNISCNISEIKEKKYIEFQKVDERFFDVLIAYETDDGEDVYVILNNEGKETVISI